MKCEFYGKSKKEIVIDCSNEKFNSIRDAIVSEYHGLEDYDSLIERLENTKSKEEDYLLVKTNKVDDGYKFIKSIDDLNMETIEASDKIEVNGRDCKISSTVYDVDNNIVKYYLDNVFFGSKISEQSKNVVSEKARENFIEKIDGLIEIIERKRDYEKRFDTEEKKTSLFKKLFE